MTNGELEGYIFVTGGKREFARFMGISVRYVDMLLAGDRKMSKELEKLIRLTINNGDKQ